MPGPTLERGVTETDAGTYAVRVMHNGVYYYVGTYTTATEANRQAVGFRASAPTLGTPDQIRAMLAQARQGSKQKRQKSNQPTPTPTTRRRKAVVTRIKELENEVARLKAIVEPETDAD